MRFAKLAILAYGSSGSSGNADLLLSWLLLQIEEDFFWCHCLSSLIHPVGWSQTVGHRLKATPGGQLVHSSIFIVQVFIHCMYICFGIYDYIHFTVYWNYLIRIHSQVIPALILLLFTSVSNELHFRNQKL